MTWRDNAGGYHPDTLLIIEIAERFLQDYFGHDAESAERVLTRFFTLKAGFIDEGYIRHEHSWRIATEAQFRVVAEGSPGDLPAWRRNKGLLETPADALEYLRRHYWRN